MSPSRPVRNVPLSQVTVDHETLRRWMLDAGLWSRARKRSPHRRRRERKVPFGELVQVDGSFHEWFEGRGPHSCLVTLVDDATGRTHGGFSAQERIWAAVTVLRGWIERYGMPQALYTDWLPEPGVLKPRRQATHSFTFPSSRI